MSEKEKGEFGNQILKRNFSKKEEENKKQQEANNNKKVANR